jgi:hypothetical protein
VPRKNDDDNPNFGSGREASDPERAAVISRHVRCLPDGNEICPKFAGWTATASGTGETAPLSALFGPGDYSSNRVTGHWRAHGKYIARESASLQSGEIRVSAESTGIDIPSKLREWQEARSTALEADHLARVRRASRLAAT